MISGATGGIGAALAEIYAGPEKTLILTGRNAPRLDEISRKCQEKGATVLSKAFDITDTKTLTEWLEQIIKITNIDLIIANAGISAGINSEKQYEPLPVVHELFKVNIDSVIHTIYPLIEHMQQQGRGQIAIMSSLAALRGLPHSPAYSASKAAIKAYGESLRALLKKSGISVSVICPGFVKTPMSDKVIGPKPFMISARKAAMIVQKKLAKKSCQITFPFPLKLSMSVLNLLPKTWTDALLMKINSHLKAN